MKTVSTTLSFLLFMSLLSLAGCADNSPEGLATQNMVEFDNLLTAAENGKSKEQLAAIFDRMIVLGEKMQASPMSDEQTKAFEEKNSQMLATIKTRTAKMATNENLMQVMKEGMEKVMQRAIDKNTEKFNQKMQNATGS